MKGEFYKMDFRAWNLGTVDLSLELEAAYLRLCHAMYDVRGPVPSSTRFLKSIFRCGNVKAVALLRQLIEADKIQCCADGKLTNRRVVNELADRARVSAKRSVAGEKGGRASRADPTNALSDAGVTSVWAATADRVASECAPSDLPVIDAKSLHGNDPKAAIASNVSTRGEEKREDIPLTPKGIEPEGFLEFRSVFPERDSRFPTTEARKRWMEAVKRGTRPEDILVGAKCYAEEQCRIGNVRTQYVKTADAWLYQRRWQDYQKSSEACSDAPAAPIADDVWRERVRRWQATQGHWPWQRSLPPDQPETKVPRHILQECGLLDGTQPCSEPSSSSTTDRTAHCPL